MKTLLVFALVVSSTIALPQKKVQTAAQGRSYGGSGRPLPIEPEPEKPCPTGLKPSPIDGGPKYAPAEEGPKYGGPGIKPVADGTGDPWKDEKGGIIPGGIGGDGVIDGGIKPGPEGGLNPGGLDGEIKPGPDDGLNPGGLDGGIKPVPDGGVEGNPGYGGGSYGYGDGGGGIKPVPDGGVEEGKPGYGGGSFVNVGGDGVKPVPDGGVEGKPGYGGGSFGYGDGGGGIEPVPDGGVEGKPGYGGGSFGHGDGGGGIKPVPGDGVEEGKPGYGGGYGDGGGGIKPVPGGGVEEGKPGYGGGSFGYGDGGGGIKPVPGGGVEGGKPGYGGGGTKPAIDSGIGVVDGEIFPGPDAGGIKPGVEGAGDVKPDGGIYEEKPGYGGGSFGGTKPAVDGGIGAVDGGIKPTYGGGIKPGVDGGIKPTYTGGIKPGVDDGIKPTYGGGFDKGQGGFKPDGHGVDPVGPNGCVCVPWYQCKDGEIISDGSGIIDPRKKHTPANELPLEEEFNPPQCGKFHVCCGSPSPITEKPYEHFCGIRKPSGINKKILNADKKGESEFGEWPWQGAIMKVENKDLRLFQCGAVLIDKRHTLTAAHCVNKFVIYDKIPLIVRFGEWDTQLTTEFLPHEDFKVERIVLHPGFKNNSLWNDVAVLKLEKDVQYAPHIDTICLPRPDSIFVGQECVVTGWGKNAYKGGSYSNILRKVKVPIIDHHVCQDLLRKTRLGKYFRLHEAFTCAGGAYDEDACKGDGGGPLACYREDGTYALAGLVSWGIDCGKPNVPGVYVDITKYLDWIKTVTEYPLEEYWPKD